MLAGDIKTVLSLQPSIQEVSLKDREFSDVKFELSAAQIFT